jgi:polyhydroxyalkanoate synthesis repressor PhaR
MTTEKQPITIKKYANRRLYNTGTSTYVTLEDLAEMVKGGEDFVVYDAKTGEDITRSVLAQIIFEQEGKEGQSLLPITFLRQIIRFYGDSMQMIVPSYLEFSIDKFVGEQQKIREQFTNSIGGQAVPGAQMFAAMEDQARKNMAMFTQALSVFNPFIAGGGMASPATDAKSEKPAESPKAEPQSGSPDLDVMKQQLAEMQRQIESLSRKD